MNNRHLEKPGMRKWKDIFWACAIVFVIQLVTTLFSSAGTLWDAARLIVSGLSLVPLYGYAYRVAIGNQAIAILIFGYNALFLTFALLLAFYTLVTGWSLFLLFSVFVLLALSFAFLFPQYKYAFDSEDLWAANA